MCESHNLVICVDLSHALDELIKKYQKREFDGEDCAPDKGKEDMNVCSRD